jgi:hypothetical protein
MNENFAEELVEILSHPCPHSMFCERMKGHDDAIIPIQHINKFECYCRRYEGKCPVGYGVPWVPLTDIADKLGWTLEETLEVAKGIETKGLVSTNGCRGVCNK